MQTQISKLLLMKVLCCGHATGQKEKSSSKYLKCTKIDVESLISVLMFLMGTTNY